MSLAEEFTEPFDLERYKNGEQAFFIAFREFWYEEDGLLYAKGGHSISIKSAQKHYKMRPLDAWTEVHGKAPFSAKAGEWEFVNTYDEMISPVWTTEDKCVAWDLIKRARRIVKKVDSAQHSVAQRPEWMKCPLLEETAQQARTRQAYTNYKAKHAPSEPYVGLRDGEIEEIAGESLARMKPWWRK